MSAVLLVFPGHFQHAVWHDLESFIHVLHWMCLRFHETNMFTPEDLRDCIAAHYTRAYRGRDGISYGGHAKLRMLSQGQIPFQLRNGSVGRPKGLHSLLVSLSDLYAEHYSWLQAQSMLPVIDDWADQASHAVQGAQEGSETRVAEMVMPSVLSELVEDTANNPDVIQPPPSTPAKVPEPALDYQHVKRAFATALFPMHGWTVDRKSVGDRFANFQRSPHGTRAKRSWSGSSDGGEEKRPRHASTATAS